MTGERVLSEESLNKLDSSQYKKQNRNMSPNIKKHVWDN